MYYDSTYEKGKCVTCGVVRPYHAYSCGLASTEQANTAIFYCHVPECGYATDSPISFGMHKSYKHNPNSKYRIWLRKARAAHLNTGPTKDRVGK